MHKLTRPFACLALAAGFSATAGAVTCGPIGCEHFGSQYDYYCETNPLPEDDYEYTWQVNTGWIITSGQGQSAIVTECTGPQSNCPSFGRKVTLRLGGAIVCVAGSVN